MKITITDVPVQLPVDIGQTPVVQNDGPGTVYLDFQDDVSEETAGLKLVSGAFYEFPRDVTRELYAVADVDSEVRILVVG